MSKEIAKIDRLDRRLLLLLDENSRQSYRAIAKKLGVPAETVRYRINSLVDKGVIAGFVSLIDAGKLGNTYYKILIKFHNVDEEQLAAVVQDLIDHEAVNWIARFDGIYDIGFTIRVQKVYELSLFIDELKCAYYRYINQLTFAVNIKVDFLLRNYLLNRKPRKRLHAAYSTSEEVLQVDQADLAILRALADDTRISASDIAERVHLTSETVRQRIDRLEKVGIIQRYRIYLNNSKLGQNNYYVFVYLNYSSEQRRRLFVEYCKQIPELVYYIKALGEWDYELSFEVSTYEKYRALMMEMTTEFSDIVRNYIGMPISEIYKFTIKP